MLNVILTVHMIACIALVIAVMLQRSEGGALGMSGGGTGGVISGRGAASALVRITMFLAGLFFITSVVMTRMNNDAASQKGVLERAAEQTTDPFDTLNTTPSVQGTPATPGDAVTSPASPAPAPSTVPDPLAPSTSTATPPAIAPATSTPSAPATTGPAAPAPATTAPTLPAPTPENGGTPN